MLGLLARVGILVGGFLALRPLVRKAHQEFAGIGTSEKKAKSMASSKLHCHFQKKNELTQNAMF